MRTKPVNGERICAGHACHAEIKTESCALWCIETIMALGVLFAERGAGSGARDGEIALRGDEVTHAEIALCMCVCVSISSCYQYQ